MGHEKGFKGRADAIFFYPQYVAVAGYADSEWKSSRGELGGHGTISHAFFSNKP
jgi:hypothetical protein